MVVEGTRGVNTAAYAVAAIDTFDLRLVCKNYDSFFLFLFDYVVMVGLVYLHIGDFRESGG